MAAEFQLVGDYRLYIERIGRKYKLLLLSPERRPLLARELGENFWLKWTKSEIVRELAEKAGASGEDVRSALDRIAGEIELRGKKILDPPRQQRTGDNSGELGIEEVGSGTLRGEEEEITDKFITDTIMGKYLFYCDKSNENLPLYVWTGTHWSNSEAEAVILHELSEIFKEEEYRSRMVLERTVNFIKGQAMNTRVEPKPPQLIPFRNGLYDIREGRMIPHDPKYFYVNVIPHDFDPNAKCPNWEKWLRETVHEEDIPFLQEWVGYNLYADYPEPGFTVLVGTGQNGKSVFMEVLVALLGHQNVTNISLATLTYDTFGPAELYHKLANISDDIGNEIIKNAGRLKEASSGSYMNAQRKFGHPFDFKNYAKITYACNEPPEIKDQTEAIKFRLKVVEFPYTFSKEPREGEKLARDRRELMEELLSEIPGIINWALDGLRRLMNSNFRFSVSRSTEEMWKFYQRKASPVVCFVEECLEFTDDENDVVFKDEMFSAFQEWLKLTGLKLRVSRDKFFKGVKELGIEAVRSREYDRRRIYVGVRFKGGLTHLNKSVPMSQAPIIEIGEEPAYLSESVPTSQPFAYPRDSQKRKSEIEEGEKEEKNENREGGGRINAWDVGTMEENILGKGSGFRAPKSKLAEELGIPLDTLQSIIGELAKRGKVVDHGGEVEVVAGIRKLSASGSQPPDIR
ncbi:MAG: phage/plasmid primase, P4 family [Candidatus Hadarchaeales archaeon]